MSFDAVRIIEAKRDGAELDPADLRGMVAAHQRGEVSDAQLAALFMAGVLRGFTAEEATALTDAYLESGEVVDLSHLDGPTVDKHSTGGVADTTTLVVGPIVAACGLQLAKLSGRGLGHTGGTLDKLEAIPGFRVDLSPDEVAAQVQRVGLAVAAATADIAPADKATYALRDVTGTVPSPALIAASIMSKKVAGGAQHIILDVKAGDGAFLPGADEAAGLADLCIRIGRAKGRDVGALVTDMSQPLGPAIGNALEVRAAVDVLRGQGGALREVALALAAGLLQMAGRGDGTALATSALDDGRAWDRFVAMVEAQGGDVATVEDPGRLAAAPVQQVVTAPTDGQVASIGCRRLGEVAVRLGAGRLHKGDPVDPAVGITLAVRVGDRVEAGQPMAVVHARDPDAAAVAAAEVGASIGFGAPPLTTGPVLQSLLP